MRLLPLLPALEGPPSAPRIPATLPSGPAQLIGVGSPGDWLGPTRLLSNQELQKHVPVNGRY